MSSWDLLKASGFIQTYSLTLPKIMKQVLYRHLHFSSAKYENYTEDLGFWRKLQVSKVQKGPEISVGDILER